MIVEGKAEGELNINDVLNIKSEGNVNGKIFYGEIQIEEGGKLSERLITEIRTTSRKSLRI